MLDSRHPSFAGDDRKRLLKSGEMIKTRRGNAVGKSTAVASAIPSKYLVHGFTAASEIELPELMRAPAEQAEDFKIVETDTYPSLPSDYGFERSADRFAIWWSMVGRFVVTKSGDVTLARGFKVADNLVRLPLVGCVMAIAALVRGRFLLHANAINVGGKGVLLMGSKGQGKSTLTAALLGRGHTLLADDAVALSIGADGAEVHRGCLQMKMWPDSIDHIWASQSAAKHRPIHLHCNKRVVDAMGYASVVDRVPLARIYLLSEGSTMKMRKGPASESWPLLVAQSYAALFGSNFFDADSKADHFVKCTRLAQSVGVTRLQRPKRFDEIGAVTSLIESDVACAAL